MSLTRALGIGLFGGFVAVASYALYVIYLVIVEVASIPSGCGFDAGENCTNPNANQHVVDVFLILGYIVFAYAMTLLLSALIRNAIGPNGVAPRPRQLRAFAAVLAVLPAPILYGLYWISIHNDPGPLDVPTALLFGLLPLLVAIGAWSILLRSTLTRREPPQPMSDQEAGQA